MRHRDPVTKELRQRVLTRDEGCIAPLVDPSQSGTCWGRLTLDHVKDEPRMAKRAPSDERHLVTVCEGHSEAGARAGYQWNTANRALERMYLAQVNGGLVSQEDSA